MLVFAQQFPHNGEFLLDSCVLAGVDCSQTGVFG